LGPPLGGVNLAWSNDSALDVNADAVAFAVLKYAMSTEDVNGVKGKSNSGK